MVDDAQGVFVVAEGASVGREGAGKGLFSRVCVRRVLKWSPSGEMKTWVLCMSLRNALAWMIRSLSRWKSLRTPSGGSGLGRPALCSTAQAEGSWRRPTPGPLDLTRGVRRGVGRGEYSLARGRGRGSEPP